jgi:hypothetical protein
MCSWCHSILADDATWRPLETALAIMPLLEQDTTVGVTHGMCPTCAERMLAQLRQSAPKS